MLKKRILSIVVTILILATPCMQVYAESDAVQDYLEDLLDGIISGENDTGTNSNSASGDVDIDITRDVSGQEIYDFYRTIEAESGKEEAVIAVSKLIEPILDEYVPLGLSKPVALAQMLMESRFFSSELSRIGNNPYGLKGDGYVGSTDEYIDGTKYVLSLSFQVYDNFEDGVRGYCHLMMKERYLPVRQANNYVGAAKAIKECGYASDPDYVGDGDIYNKPIIGILDNIAYYELDQFTQNSLDPETRNDYIWYDIKKISWGQSLVWDYLKPRSEEIQKRLQSLGYYDSVIDGWFGNKSKYATIDFQKDNDLYVDGVVGIYTYEALFPEKFTATIGVSDVVYQQDEQDDSKAKWNITASSYLIPENLNNGPFSADMMLDNKNYTCWIPDRNLYGIGESITLSLANAQNANFDTIEILAGYGRSDAHYYTNYRIKNVSIYIDDTHIGDFELEDRRSEQSIELGKEYSGSEVMIKINDCYASQNYDKYKAWDDLCVSEIWIDGDILE